MIVIVGLVVLLAAVIVGFIGCVDQCGAAHPWTENFSVFGYHVTGSTGTLFLFGIVIGAVGMLGLCVLLAGARRTARRGRDARHELKNSQRETAFLNRDRDKLLEQQQGAERLTGALGRGDYRPRQGSPVRSVVARSTTDGHRAPRQPPLGTQPNHPQSPKTKESAMSIGKKIAHKAEAVKGAAKKYLGRATGNTRLRTEGRVDQFKGNTKQAGDKVKDAFKH
jgi:uncharacterized protein YjbJ (UPF0337 family)